METTESCRLCEKLSVTLGSDRPLKRLMDLPNTFDAAKQKCVWKQSGLMAYALLPRSIRGKTGIVDLYICMDEDDLDDVDLFRHAQAFLKEQVLPSWQTLKDLSLAGPNLASPPEIGCWKLRHAAGEEAP